MDYNNNYELNNFFFCKVKKNEEISEKISKKSGSDEEILPIIKENENIKKNYRNEQNNEIRKNI